jgi:hypothetical protein
MSNWSNDSQTHTQICILESQIEVKRSRVLNLEAENLVLKKEVERLQALINKLVEIETK